MAMQIWELDEPYPADSLPGCPLAYAMSSGTVFTGSLGLTISTSALVPMRATGAKSLTGS